MGCKGGFIDAVLDYAQEHPIIEESVYPYEEHDDYECDLEDFIGEATVFAKSTGGVNLVASIENFKTALN